MNYTKTAKANDERRYAQEAMHDAMEAREQRQRFATLHPEGPFEAYPGAYSAICDQMATQPPILTLEAARARISAIREIAEEWQYSHEGLNPGLFEAELSSLEAFIANNP